MIRKERLEKARRLASEAEAKLRQERGGAHKSAVHNNPIVPFLKPAFNNNDDEDDNSTSTTTTVTTTESSNKRQKVLEKLSPNPIYSLVERQSMTDIENLLPKDKFVNPREAMMMISER